MFLASARVLQLVVMVALIANTYQLFNFKPNIRMCENNKLFGHKLFGQRCECNENKTLDCRTAFKACICDPDKYYNGMRCIPIKNCTIKPKEDGNQGNGGQTSTTTQKPVPGP